MADAIQPRSQVNNATSIVTAAGTLFNANTSRVQWTIQNVGTDTLYVKLGAGASSSDYHVALAAGSAADDGLGGFLSSDVVSYNGIVTIAGTTVRAAVVEL